MSTAAARVRRPRTDDIAPSGRRSTARDQVRQVKEQPQLHVVRGVAPARATMPFLLVVVAILVGALAASMLLNAKMADTAYKMKAAQTELNVLNDHIETVRSDVQEASSPGLTRLTGHRHGHGPGSRPRRCRPVQFDPVRRQRRYGRLQVGHQ